MQTVKGPDDLAAVAKIRAARPSKADALAVPGARYQEKADGSWTIKVGSKQGRAAVRELLAPHRRLAADRGRELNARQVNVPVRRADGTTVYVGEQNEARVCRINKARPVIHVTQRYGVERFPDGLLWRELPDGDWECTGQCSLTRPFVSCGLRYCFWCGGEA